MGSLGFLGELRVGSITDLLVDPSDPFRAHIISRLADGGHSQQSDSDERRKLSPRLAGRLTLEPARDRRDYVTLLVGRQRTPRFYAMPFRETRSAARRRRMLRDEDRMPAHRRLLAIVGWCRGCEPFGDERPRVLDHRRHPLGGQVVAITWCEREAATEGRLRQRIE